jgi:hypothetical protein
MRALCALLSLLALCIQPVVFADPASPPSASADQASAAAKTADASQSFTSPLGLGNAATLSVTDKSALIAAAISGSLPQAYFWQIGVSGATDKNNNALVYDSSDKDAPGFKGKAGIGYSSFQSANQRSYEKDYSARAGLFLAQAWCLNVLKSLGETVGEPILSGKIDDTETCSQRSLELRQVVLALQPSAAVTQQTLTDVTSIITMLSRAGDMPADAEKAICSVLKTKAKDAYNYCPGSGSDKSLKSPEDERVPYPNAYLRIVGPHPLPTFYFKISASYAPTLVSTDYRSVTNGTPDLADSQHWQRLLNSGVVDLSLYYAAWSAGVEAGYGQTVTITQSNVCNTTTIGSYSSQQCKTAMIGEPTPQSTYSATVTVQNSTLLSGLAAGAFRPGFQLTAHYERPTNGSSHLTTLSLPLYTASPSSPLKLVFGIEPEWIWNTNPKVGNSFGVTLFVGTRPGLPADSH